MTADSCWHDRAVAWLGRLRPSDSGGTGGGPSEEIYGPALEGSRGNRTWGNDTKDILKEKKRL